jgi:transposase
VAEGALCVKKMGMRPGGKQPVFADTVWEGQPQSFAFSVGDVLLNAKKDHIVGADDSLVGVAKGMEQMLRERGLWVPHMTAAGGADKRLELSAEHVLGNCEDFASVKPLVQDICETAGHIAIWLPKFHCECNPIEYVWGRAKYLLRTCEKAGTFKYSELCAELPVLLQGIELALIRMYFRKARAYMDALRELAAAGEEGGISEAHRRVKGYKSHRRPAPSEFAADIV